MPDTVGRLTLSPQVKILMFDLTDFDSAKASLRAEKAEFYQLVLWEMYAWLIDKKNHTDGSAIAVYEEAFQRLRDLCERYDITLED